MVSIYYEKLKPKVYVNYVKLGLTLSCSQEKVKSTILLKLIEIVGRAFCTSPTRGAAFSLQFKLHLILLSLWNSPNRFLATLLSSCTSLEHCRLISGSQKPAYTKWSVQHHAHIDRATIGICLGTGTNYLIGLSSLVEMALVIFGFILYILVVTVTVVPVCRNSREVGTLQILLRLKCRPNCVKHCLKERLWGGNT